MSKMNMHEWSQFNRTFWAFGMAALAVYKADYLLDKANKVKLSKPQKEQIIRESNFAQMNLQHYFKELMSMGIPGYMLSMHLKVDSPETGEND